MNFQSHFKKAITLALTFIIVSGSAIALAQRPGVPPNVLVAVIDQRDYQGNITTTDRALFPTPHPGLEFSAHRNTPQQPDTHQNVTHVAYIKGATSTISLRLTNQQNTTATGTLTFTGAQLVVPGPNNAPAPQELPVSLTCSSPTFTLPPFASTTMTATLSGLPSHVAVGQLQVKFELPVSYGPPGNPGSSNNGTNGGWVNWERICILNSAPIELQELPWTDFLEYSCRWAYGAASDYDTHVRMTEGMFLSRHAHNNWLYYDPSVESYWTPEYDPEADEPLNLSQFLLDIGNPNSSPERAIPLDCRGFSGILHLALSSHGLSTACAMVLPESNDFFTTWPLCPAGADPNLTGPAYLNTPTISGNYQSVLFAVHMLVYAGESTFDASNAYFYNSAGSTWAKPAYFWNIASHWQKSDHPYFGLAFRYTSNDWISLAMNVYNFYHLPAGLYSEEIPKTLIPNYKPSSVH